MGFNFRGLTSGALVANNSAAVDAEKTDISNIPAAVAGHTGHDIETGKKSDGVPRSIDTAEESDEELRKVDTTAQHGVQSVQAMTHVWSKRDLILAYIW